MKESKAMTPLRTRFQTTMSISTVPCSQGLVDPAIRVVRRLGTRKFLLHTRHTGAERLLTRPTFRLRALQTRLAGVSTVVGSPAFGV